MRHARQENIFEEMRLFVFKVLKQFPSLGFL